MDTPLYEQIYEYVLNEVKEGRLRPGDRVSSEKELADQFGVSRITSKSALEKLAQSGVVLRIKGKGTYVAEGSDAPDGDSHESVPANGIPEEAIPGSAAIAAKRLFGLILPDFSESFGLGLVYAIEERCSELGMRLLLKRSYGRQDEEESAIDIFMELGVDGLIIFPVHGEHYNTGLLRLVLNRFPVVLIDRYLKGIPACSVYTDNRQAAQELTSHLFQQGHKRIAFMSPPTEHTSTIEDRLNGFMDAYLANGLLLNPQYLVTQLRSTLPTSSFNMVHIRADEDIIREFTQEHPEVTAFVASEYNLALLLWETLTKMGRRLPDDYSVACFDSTPHVFDVPLFTHIAQDENMIGRTAVDILMSQVEGEEPPLYHTVQFQMVQGRSIKKFS